MDWSIVAAWCLEHICFERQRCGVCGCKGRRACRIGQELAQQCEALHAGTGTVEDMQAVLKFVKGKACGLSRGGKECNHRGCIRSERIQAWIADEVTATLAAAA
jgi:hypothetical protein